MADDEVPPVQPVHGARRTEPVREPAGRRGWWLWAATLARQRFRGRSPASSTDDSAARASAESQVARRALEDELTGEGKILDIDA